MKMKMDFVRAVILYSISVKPSQMMYRLASMKMELDYNSPNGVTIFNKNKEILILVHQGFNFLYSQDCFYRFTMYSIPGARSTSLTMHRLAQVVFFGVAAAVQLSSCTETSTMATDTSTSTTSTSTSTSMSLTNTASTTARTATETGPPTLASSLLDPTATSLAIAPEWCPTYHGAYCAPMIPNVSGKQQPFGFGTLYCRLPSFVGSIYLPFQQ